MTDTIDELEAMIDEMDSELNEIVGGESSGSSSYYLKSHVESAESLGAQVSSAATLSITKPNFGHFPPRHELAENGAFPTLLRNEMAPATLIRKSPETFNDVEDVDLEHDGDDDADLQRSATELSKELNRGDIDTRDSLLSPVSEPSPLAPSGVEKFLMGVERLSEFYSHELAPSSSARDVLTDDPTSHSIEDSTRSASITGYRSQTAETTNSKLLQLASIINQGGDGSKFFQHVKDRQSSSDVSSRMQSSDLRTIASTSLQGEILQPDENGNYFTSMDSESECDREEDCIAQASPSQLHHTQQSSHHHGDDGSLRHVYYQGRSLSSPITKPPPPPQPKVDATKEQGAKQGNAWSSWLGATGIKAAGIGLGLASAGWEATRTSIVKVSEVTSKAMLDTYVGAATDNPKRLQVYEAFMHERGVVETVVSAGSITQIPFVVPRGRAILWKVMVKYLDIDFTVKLRVQEIGGAVEIKLEPTRRIVAITAHSHSHSSQSQSTFLPEDPTDYNPTTSPTTSTSHPVAATFTGDGSDFCLIGGRPAMADEDRYIVLVLDNSYSTLRPKCVAYRVQIGSPEEISILRDKYITEVEAVLHAEKRERQQLEADKEANRQKLLSASQPECPEDAEQYDFLSEDLRDKYGYDEHQAKEISEGPLLVKNILNVAGATTDLLMKAAKSAASHIRRSGKEEGEGEGSPVDAFIEDDNTSSSRSPASTTRKTIQSLSGTSSPSIDKMMSGRVRRKSRSFKEMLEDHEGMYKKNQSNGQKDGSEHDITKEGGAGTTLRTSGSRIRSATPSPPPFKSPTSTSAAFYSAASVALKLESTTDPSSSEIPVDHHAVSLGVSSYELLAASVAGATAAAPLQRIMFDTKAVLDPDAFWSLWSTMPDCASFSFLVEPTPDFVAGLPYSLATLLRVCGTYMIAVGEPEASTVDNGIAGHRGVYVYSYIEGLPSSPALSRRHIGPIRFLLETVLVPYDLETTAPTSGVQTSTTWRLQLQVKISDPQYLSELLALLNFGASFRLAPQRSYREEAATLFHLLGLVCLAEPDVNGGVDDPTVKRLIMRVKKGIAEEEEEEMFV